MINVLPKTVMQRLDEAERRIAELERQLGADDRVQRQIDLQRQMQSTGLLDQQALTIAVGTGQQFLASGKG